MLPHPPKRQLCARIQTVSQFIATIVLCTCTLSTTVYAQTPQDVGIEPRTVDLGPTERVLAVIGAALSLLPANLGADVLLTPTQWDRTRLAIGWPFQIPIRPGRYRTRTATFTNHRILVEPSLMIGAQPGLNPAEIAWITFEPRIGYRLVVHPSRGVFGVQLGLSHALRFWPTVSPTISPELGLHVGVCCGDPAFVWTLLLRTDFDPIGPDTVRIGLHTGWAFY